MSLNDTFLNRNWKIIDIKESTMEIKEAVNHPSHYNREGSIECIDEMVALFGVEETMSFCKLNAWKYRYRAADKNGAEDLKKSDWYIKRYMDLQEILSNIKTVELI